ncbi:YraN family protein [Corynebacterium bouchesdurhonense]|uniref:YraN family protein n=1 Tax=Corynebacterium bouchesdurhonense TaxID=1720192 RepID=UPI001E537FA7|nr:YraN family protein [Corynebacterium bouchesdurhonense]
MSSRPIATVPRHPISRTARGDTSGPPPHPESEFADQYALGRAGEGAAVCWYEEDGYTYLASRVRCRAGELDAVMLAPDGTVVFVEVKTRRGGQYGGAEAVGAKKLATMRRCAAEWLERRPEQGYAPVRFDVCELIFDAGGFRARRYEGVEDGAC